MGVDSTKTATACGAGTHGEIKAAYRCYAETCRFYVEACKPYSPEHKGKVERHVLVQRMGEDPADRVCSDVAELQAWSDEANYRSARRRTCPATGTSVWEAWQAEPAFLQPVPILPEPFDVGVTRPVGRDCMVAFESRNYSVPLCLCGSRVEVRGCASVVRFVAEARVVAEHQRHTRERILIDPSHFEGAATEEVLPPLPLGRMGRRIAEFVAMAPERG